VNGKSVYGAIEPLSYAVVERTWADGDTIEVEFGAEISVDVWEKNKKSVSVNRGPLTFSLKIGEKWIRYEGKDRDNKKWRQSDDNNKWPAYEVHPTTAWNYGLVFAPIDRANCFKVVKKPGPVAEQPFTPEGAPIELRAQAKKIPEWTMDDLGLVGKLPQSPFGSDEPTETVTLIPMGCARLRISAFPQAMGGCKW
jgi:hypothetical protein